MTRFDVKCLPAALLRVEDLMSVAGGLESCLLLLDHPLGEFVATVPAKVNSAVARASIPRIQAGRSSRKI